MAVRKPYHVIKCAAAVVLFSCVVFLCAGPGSFDNYWCFLKVCRTCYTAPNRIGQGEEIQSIGDDEKNYNSAIYQVRKHHEEGKVRLNVTDVVLRELQKGFFAAVTENRNYHSSFGTVCVSEPTVLECGNAGFAALLLATLDHVSYCHMLGIDDMVMQWKNCRSSCIKDPQINSWPAYFESLNSGIELNASKVLCLGGIVAGPVLAREVARTVKILSPQQIKQFNWALKTSSLLEVGFRKRQSLPGYEEGATITPKLRKLVNDLITKYVRPQISIQVRVEQFYSKNMQGFNMLGVHVRGTDHWAETEEKTLPPVEQWIHDTQALFETMKEPKKIFIASDNDESIERFVQHFGKDKVVFTAAKRARSYHSAQPVHSMVTNHPIELGSQVLIDILLLAKCGHFLHGESSVASLAAFFNPEMKLSFLGHLEDDLVNDDSNEKPLPDLSDQITEIEWEEEWDEQLKTLVQCYEANSPYSACPNMARGQLIEAKDVIEILAHNH